MVYLRSSGSGKSHNFMASAYAREPGSEYAYVSWINGGGLRYADMQKVAALGLEEGTVSQFKPHAGDDSVLTPEKVNIQIIPPLSDEVNSKTVAIRAIIRPFYNEEWLYCSEPLNHPLK